MNLRYGRLAYLRGHIPGARYVDLNQDLSAAVTPSSGRHTLPAPEVFAATLDRLRISHTTQVIAYDEANGSFAARAWWMLRWVGHRSAAVLDGGLQAWIAGGGALASGDENHPAYAQPGAGFLPRVAAAAVIGTREVEARQREGRPLIVDARAAERFSGSVEPIDAVAGHIAGAVNHPFTRNLAP